MHHEWHDPAYADMRRQLADASAAYVANAGRARPRRCDDPRAGPAWSGSTDMGNVSYLVPSIHPMIQVAPPGVPIHTPEFAAYAGGEEGDRAVLDGAKAHGHDRRRPVGATRRSVADGRREAAFEARRPAARPGRGRRTAERSPLPAADLVASPAVTVYVAEEFTPDEADILRRYFTNLDGPVFALVNLPEVVKGALFARYSPHRPRACGGCSSTSSWASSTSPATSRIDATVGLRRAEELYERVFFEYGDDSVAQLGGVHLACEQASNLLTKVLEWGRLMSYLEQSHPLHRLRRPARRPLPLLPRPGGARLAARHPLRGRHGPAVRHLRRAGRRASPSTSGPRVPKDPADSDFVYRQAIRAKAFDAVRGILPAASLSNVGIYGTGQGFEQLLLRMRAHPLPEARAYADLMLHELRKVIPSFLRRVDLADRGGAWSEYLADDPRPPRPSVARAPVRRRSSPRPGPGVALTDFDPDAEDKLVAAISTRTPTCPSTRCWPGCGHAAPTTAWRSCGRTWGSGRTAATSRAGRSSASTTASTCCPTTAPSATCSATACSPSSGRRSRPRHGYVRPEPVDDAGLTDAFDAAMERSAALYDVLVEPFPQQAAYHHFDDVVVNLFISYADVRNADICESQQLSNRPAVTVSQLRERRRSSVDAAGTDAREAEATKPMVDRGDSLMVVFRSPRRERDYSRVSGRQRCGCFRQIGG